MRTSSLRLSPLRTRAGALAAAALVSAAALGAPRPTRVLSGYTGYFLGGHNGDHVVRMIDGMGENGFNAIDVKIHADPKRNRFIAGCLPEVKALVTRARERGLAFNVYLYPTCTRRDVKNPAHAARPAPVDALGQTIAGAFLMTDPAAWRIVFSEAYGYAEHRRTLGFASLRFDIETLPAYMSYDDGNWKLFCRATPGFSEKTPAAERAALLSEKGKSQQYAAFFNNRLRRAVRAFVKELRALSPTLELGYMPARDAPGLPAIFNTELATDRLPAWLDGWDLYNGAGYRPGIKATHGRMRRLHPMNRYITWTCPNRYQPGDVASSVYHAAANTDGYSIWVLTMLDEKRANTFPKGCTHADYWAAFSRANAAIRADLAEGTIERPSRIAHVAVKPRVAALSWEGVTAPALDPAGDGSGGDVALVMRMTQNLFVYAAAGEDLRIDIRHLSGQARPTGLQYVLLSPSGKAIRNEAVTAGSRHNFTVPAEETGIYVFRATSGNMGGGPWYSVRVAAPHHWAVDARSSAYIYRPQTFYVDGADAGNPRLRILTAGGESFNIDINGERHEVIRKKQVEFDLPPGLVKIALSRSKAGYGGNFRTSFPGGKSPFIYPVKERRLKLKIKEEVSK